MTFSILAFDRKQELIGSAVASKWTGVGGCTQFFRPGTGLVTIQNCSYAQVAYRILDNMECGETLPDSLEKALADIDSINLDFENTKNDLNSQLENEVNAKNELDNLLNSTREELQQTKEAAAAKEEDLFSQLQVCFCVMFLSSFFFFFFFLFTSY